MNTLSASEEKLSMVFQLALLPLAVLLFYALVRLSKRTDRDLPLPPKPPGQLLLGNLVEVIGESKKYAQHLLMERWARRYGDIFRVQVGPVTEYFLNSDTAVKALFDKASAQTAQRPRWIVSNELICQKLNVLLLDADDPRWKHQRRVIHSALTSVSRADAGLSFLHFETAKFLHDIVKDPSVGLSCERLWGSMGRYTYSTFSSQVFGMEVPINDHPVIDYIHETGLAQILGTIPGMYMVDILPILTQLPLFMKPWERDARARFKRDMAWSIEKLNRIKNSKANGSIIPLEAFLPTVVHDEKKMGFQSEEEAAYLSLQLVIGAADTSRMSTWSFLEAMMTFPDVQQKAYAEVQRLVGERLPVYSDLERIPYIRCVMKEVWRWRPPVSLGHPHTTSRELTYNGYRIPKGARLHLNAWAIGHDPARHAEPEFFRPERYADDSTNTMQSINSPDVSQRDHFAFGSGRRVCPGYHVAERSLAVAIMRILWAFRITSGTTAKLPLNPADYRAAMPGNPGTNMPVRLVLRSEEKARIIEHTFKSELELRGPMESLA